MSETLIKLLNYNHDLTCALVILGGVILIMAMLIILERIND